MGIMLVHLILMILQWSDQASISFNLSDDRRQWLPELGQRLNNRVTQMMLSTEPGYKECLEIYNQILEEHNGDIHKANIYIFKTMGTSDCAGKYAFLHSIS